MLLELYAIRDLLNSGKTIFDIPLKVTYYARVSTDKYEQANSLKNQVDYFVDMIQTNKNWQYVTGYVDEGFSGTSVNKRDSFLKMIQDAKKGIFDFIVTKEISRFSRSTFDSIRFTQELLRYGVGVLFQSDNINTFYPDSELRLTIMSSIAQEEVRKLSERVKFGFKRSIENGRVLGNAYIWGYRKEDGKLIVDEKEAEIIRLIFSLYTGGQLGLRTISKELAERGFFNKNGNPFSFSTLKNIISNPKYKGYYCGNKTRIVDYRLKEKVALDEEQWVMYKDEVNVPAIVNEEMWEQANLILNMRSEKSKANENACQSRYTYSGKIFCAEHNTTFHRMLYRYKSGEKETWQCKKYRENGSSGCRAPTIYTTELDVTMQEVFEEFIVNRTEIIHRMMERYKTAFNSIDIQRETDKNKKEANRLIQMKNKILELSLEGKLSNDEFYNRNEKLNADINALRIQGEKLKKEPDKKPNDKEALHTLSELIKKKALLADEKGVSEIVTIALEKIVVHKTGTKDKVKLELHFRFSNPYEIEFNRKNIGKRSHHFASDNTYDACQYYY